MKCVNALDQAHNTIVDLKTHAKGQKEDDEEAVDQVNGEPVPFG